MTNNEKVRALPAKFRRDATVTSTAEGLALCHDHADELEAALAEQPAGGGVEAVAYVPRTTLASVNANVRLGRDAVFTAYTKQLQPDDVPVYLTLPPPARVDDAAVERALAAMDACHHKAYRETLKLGCQNRNEWMRAALEAALKSPE